MDSSSECEQDRSDVDTVSSAGGGGFVSLLDEKLEVYIMVVLLSFLILLIGGGVFARYVLNESATWSVQTATYVYVFVSWVGASYAVKERLHLRMDMFRQRLPSRIQIGVIVLSKVLFVAMMVMIMFQLFNVVQLQRSLGRNMFGVPSVKIWWFYGSVLIAGGLMILRLVQTIVEDVQVYRERGEFVESRSLFE